MVRVLYIEDEVADHVRTQEIVARFPKAIKVPCRRYGEVFNRKAQNFRLQKHQPALILARKHSGHLLDAPLGYNIGGEHNFYFSHMLNCLYDCRYCFLQGMYRSANYVLFVNYEDFDAAICAQLEAQNGAPAYFFSGYDCDSLAMEPVTGFARHAVEFFRDRENAYLELRTKSTQIRELLNMPVAKNCIVAYSVAPAELAAALEHKAPLLEQRLEAIEKLQAQGWPIGLRIDPLIYCVDYKRLYTAFFEQLFSRVNLDTLHSVSLGAFRLPPPFFQKMQQLYPQEPLFAGPLEERGGLVSYPQEIEQELLSFCRDRVLSYIPQERFFPCYEEGAADGSR